MYHLPNAPISKNNQQMRNHHPNSHFCAHFPKWLQFLFWLPSIIWKLLFSLFRSNDQKYTNIFLCCHGAYNVKNYARYLSYHVREPVCVCACVRVANGRRYMNVCGRFGRRNGSLTLKWNTSNSFMICVLATGYPRTYIEAEAQQPLGIIGKICRRLLINEQMFHHL